MENLTKTQKFFMIATITIIIAVVAYALTMGNVSNLSSNYAI